MDKSKDMPKQSKGRGFGPMGPGAGGGEKAKNFSQSMKQLLGYLSAFKIQIIVVIILSIIATVFTIVGPKIMGKMTDQLVDDIISQFAYEKIIEGIPDGLIIPEGTTIDDLTELMPEVIQQQVQSQKQNTDQIPNLDQQQNPNFNLSDTQVEKIKNLDLSQKPSINWDKLRNLAYWLLGLYVFSSIFSYIQSWITINITQKVTYNLRQEISQKINRMPLKYFDTKSFGDVLSRITNDVDTIGQNLNQSLSQLISSVATLIGILVMMLSINWQLTLIAIISLPLSVVIISMIIKKSQKYFKDQQNILGKLNGHIEEMYAGHSIVKIFNGEKKSIAKFNNSNVKMYQNAWKSQFFSSLMWPIMNIIGNLDYVVIAIIGGNLAINQKITIGDIQAFIQYVKQFNQPVMQTANIANIFQAMVASAERVFEFLAEGEEVPEPKNPKFIKKLEGGVEFKNVRFSYDTGNEVIKGFSTKIKPGQTVAIVGPTGAGKTTIVNLLMRFYDVDSGSIKVDGVNVKDIRRKELRNIFGMVLQDTWLFRGTILENLKYGKLTATEEKVRKIAKIASVDHFVQSLPNGYEMELNEEASNISQGEKQLLTIARAMLANHPILILDEATSNVDTRTEILIQKSMEKLMEGKTSFVIAHRLSTIKNSDLILVMRDGNIVEQGSHTELMKQGGFYNDLYNSQFKKD